MRTIYGYMEEQLDCIPKIKDRKGAADYEEGKGKLVFTIITYFVFFWNSTNGSYFPLRFRAQVIQRNRNKVWKILTYHFTTFSLSNE